MLNQRTIDNFISRHHLPDKFNRLIKDHYMPLAAWLVKNRRNKQTLFLGISGAQGTGKSTLAKLLKLVLEQNSRWQVAILSLDDFYYTKAKREQLGKETHPLLRIRGVPGTHDIDLLQIRIRQLQNLGVGSGLSLPRFVKAQDDRAPTERWPIVTGPIDLIILEGWCIGTAPQEPNALNRPINDLERNSDPIGTWRRFVNRALKNEYAAIFSKLDFLFFLQAPDFATAQIWRQEQEEKLIAESPADCTGTMTQDQLAQFAQHFERLTRANLISLPVIADIVLRLDKNHDCVQRIDQLFVGDQSE